MSKDIIAFIALLVLGIVGVFAFLVSVIRKQKRRKTEIIKNKRQAASISDAILEEKRRMEEHEESLVLLHNAENTADVVYLRRQMVNLTTTISNLLKNIPDHVRFDSNILANQLSFATSSYVKTTLRDLIANSIENGADHITIDHKELVKSNRLVYRDNRKTGLDNDNFTVMNNMREYDPMFGLKINKPSGLFSLDLDFVFTKSNEPRIVGKLYTPEEIDSLYGSEIIHEIELSLNKYKSYLNLSGAYTYFRLSDSGLTIAKEVNKQRVDILSEKAYPADLVFKYFSTSKLREIILNSQSGNVKFQNRLKDGKIMFVVGYNHNYLQASRMCPPFCGYKLNGILH